MTIKKTLITGSRGYVASFFIKKYKNRLNLCTLKKKLKDIDVLKKEHELENVIHFASINKFLEVAWAAQVQYCCVFAE